MITVSKPYNHSVSNVTLNRILIFLGVLGLFVAGVLSMEHRYMLEIPCSTGGGCETVARHPSSYIGGPAGIPVAYVGLLGYIFFTCLAVIRGFTGLYGSKFLTLTGYIASAFGMIASIYLQYISFTVIQAKCAWCMGSAAIMIATFILYSMLFSRLSSVETETKPTTTPAVLYQGIAGILIAYLAVLGVTHGNKSVSQKAEVMDTEVAKQLIPEPRSVRNQLGPDDAPVTLIEYADLCCPQCRQGFPKIHEIVAHYPGKIRVIYRHFPIYQLPGHEMALPAAITAEIAGQKGKFWQFADAFTAADEAPKTRDGLDGIASTVGITAGDIDKVINDETSQPQKNLARDFKEALDIFKIKSTPTYMLYVKGLPVKKMGNIVGVITELETPEYQKLLKQ